MANDKKLKIDIEVDSTGDDGAKAAADLQGIETAAGDAQVAAEGLEKSLSDAGEVTIAPQVETSSIEEAKDEAGALTESLEAAGDAAVAPQVDTAQIAEATDETQKLADGLAAVDGEQVTINVDSSQIADANDALRDTGDVADESGDSLRQTAADYGTIISGSQSLGSYLKSLGKLLKSTGLGGTDAAKGIGLASVAMKVFNLVTKSNPWLALAGGVAAAIGAFALFKRKADDSTTATEGVKEETVKFTSELEKEAAAVKVVEDRLKGLADKNTAAQKATKELAEAQAKAARAQVDLDEASGTIDKPEADRRRAILAAQSDTDALNRTVEEVRQKWSAAAGEAFTDQAAAEMARNAANRAVNAVGAQLTNLESNANFNQFMKDGEFDTAAAEAFIKKVKAPEFAGQNLDTRRDKNLAEVLQKELDRLAALKEQAVAKVEAALAAEREAAAAKEIAATEQGRFDQAVNIAAEKQKAVDLEREAALVGIDADQKKAQAKESQAPALQQEKTVTTEIAEKTGETADNIERARDAMQGTATAATAAADAASRASAPLQRSTIPGLNTDQPVDLFNPARPQGLTPALTSTGPGGFGTQPSAPVPPAPAQPGQPGAQSGASEAIGAAGVKATESAAKIESAVDEAGEKISSACDSVEKAVSGFAGKMEAKINALAARISALGG